LKSVLLGLTVLLSEDVKEANGRHMKSLFSFGLILTGNELLNLGMQNKDLR